MNEPQSAETMISTPRGVVHLSAEATRILFEMLSDEETPTTRAQLSWARTEIPEEERQAVCERLGNWLRTRPPDQQEGRMESDQLGQLHAAVCVA